MARASAFGWRWLGLNALVVAAYVAAAAVGFELAFVAEQVTTVWAPTGIALAALLIGGLQLWPAVWVGALLANAGTSAPLWTALVIATGNTLEAVAAVWWLRRRQTFEPTLERVSDVLSFVIVAGLICTAIAATVGVSTLCIAGVQPWARFPAVWFDWWLGDALGAVVFAPALLTTALHTWSRRDGLRTVLWILASMVVTHLVFGHVLGASSHPIEYVVFPLAIGAAVTGGPPVTTWVVLSASAVAIWHTVHGTGPFSSPEVHYSLVLLQSFMGILAGTSLLLAAAIAERLHLHRLEREAAASLRHRQEMLRLAQHAGGVATFEWDVRNQVAHCSAEFFAIFGLPAADGVITAQEWGRFVHPDDRDRMAAHLARAIERAEPASADYRINTADGRTRWLSYAGRLQQTPDGERMVGTVVDVTEPKRAEMALREAKMAAESANQLKDQFLATLSHELRTPLNVILGYARMLLTNAIPEDTRGHAIAVIERNAVAQHRLVEELLDMSRITTGKVRIDPQPVPVVILLGEAIEGVKPAAEAKGVVLDVELDPYAGMVWADMTRLQQVFWNVLTNAVKFTKSGGRIVASVTRDDRHVAIGIVDSGVGIAPEFLPFVFEPFRQADGGLQRAHGGLGLGLAITKQLVELHGGAIAVSSPGIGQGTTVTIRLPRVMADQQR